MNNNDILRINNTYLVKRFSNISSVTIINITNKAYKILWNADLNKEKNNFTWELINEFHRDYDILENISDFISVNTQKENFLNIEIELIPCPTCNGSGSVFDFTSTTGSKTCPNCFGEKMILNKKKISKKK